MDVPVNWPEFLAAPDEVVAHVAPVTMIFSAGGTRRHAALVGIPAPSPAYARWMRKQMTSCFELIFRHGVRHIVTGLGVQSQLEEVTAGYREHLLEWYTWGLTGPEALADYARLGWRVRLIGGQEVPTLQHIAERLAQVTPQQSTATLWWFWAPGPDRAWQAIFDAVHQAGAQTHADAVRALYGEEIPAATLLLSYGKPVLSPELAPPLLVGDLHCYWRQRPGVDLSEQEFRTILYDYVYLRPTWRADKTGRAGAALLHRTAWEHAPTLGLGMRVGPFWFPAPTPTFPVVPDGGSSLEGDESRRTDVS